VASWEQRDPIVRFERYLRRAGLWSDEVARRTTESAAGLRTRLREAIVDAPDPDPLEVFDHVFADGTPDLESQAAQMAGELQREQPGLGPQETQPGRGPQDSQPGRGPQDSQPGRGPQDSQPGRGERCPT
jgi:uncharacterized protein with von Willebrand factor type A (vWA) domain